MTSCDIMVWRDLMPWHDPRGSNGSAMKALTDRRTDTHTDRTDLILSTTDVYGTKWKGGHVQLILLLGWQSWHNIRWCDTKGVWAGPNGPWLHIVWQWQRSFGGFLHGMLDLSWSTPWCAKRTWENSINKLCRTWYHQDCQTITTPQCKN